MNVKFKIGIKSKLATQTKVAGAWYLCKDVGELYYCDGTDFILVDASNNLKQLTVTAGSGLTGGGNISSSQKTVTISHQSKPTTGSDAGGSGSLVTGVEIDSLGHVVKTTKGSLEGGATAADGHYVSGVTVSGKKVTVATKEFPKIAAATQADNATNASHATEADHATNADNATNANNANKVTNKLTFTGHQSESYDGSKAISVAIPTAYTSTPKMNGTGAQGTSTSWAKGDHVHPSDTSKLDVSKYDTLIAKSFNVAVSYKHAATTSNSFSITAATHGCGVNPLVQVLDSNGNVVICGITIDSTGKVTISQNESASITVIIKGEKSITLASLLS